MPSRGAGAVCFPNTPSPHGDGLASEVRMVSIAGEARPRRPVPHWHKAFLAMLPQIIGHARVSFRHLKPEARAEAVQEVVCNALKAFVRLVERGKADSAYPSPLARYAVAQVCGGRKVGCKLNVRDVLSPYCQRQKNVIVERLDHFDEEENAWAEAVVEDTRTAPVADIVAFRIDFAAWLRCLPRRNRRIAEFLGPRQPHQRRRPQVRCERGPRLAASPRVGQSWRTFVGEGPVGGVVAALVRLDGRPVRAMRAGRPSLFRSLEDEAYLVSRR